jgi:regulator of sigma E protease
MSYVLAFLAFAALITLHEAGHFAAAKAVGMRVERFSLFFGPMFVKRRIGETEYGIGVVPLGGFVKITGMSPNETFDSPEIEARAYINQPPWKRIAVIAGGPAVNIVLAILLAWIFFLGSGNHAVIKNGQEIATGRVVAVLSGSAAQGVLHAGDVVVAVDGVKGSGIQQLHDRLAHDTCAGGVKVEGCAATTAVTLAVRRNGVTRTVSVHPRWSQADKQMLIGIAFAARTAPNGVAYSLGQSVTQLWSVSKRTVKAIVEIFKPKQRSQLHSVVGGYKYVQEGIATGWTSGVSIIALISLALGIINLFPFLPLDGGHIFWALVEQVRGRRVPWVVIERATFVGIGLVLILMVVGISNDIHHIANHTLGQN